MTLWDVGVETTVHDYSPRSRAKNDVFGDIQRTFSRCVQEQKRKASLVVLHGSEGMVSEPLGIPSEFFACAMLLPASLVRVANEVQEVSDRHERRFALHQPVV